jgi:2-oxo-3-hexenedioate decarboxylase
MTPELLLRHLDEGTPWASGCGLSVAEAYERALSVRQLRIRRGEQPRGFKVGFTNRTIWPRYGVYGPIWGTVWNTTLSFCQGDGEISLNGLCQPRIEPECVFGLKATPPARATHEQLLACVEWVAPGFEIVQSHMPEWKFTAADTVADSGLHARLLVGRKIAMDRLPADAQAFDAQLAASRITLFRGAERVDEGTGSNVLDGPLHALAHFVAALRECPGASDLQPGDVVTTGTWTDAWPVHRGEQWRAHFDAPLDALTVRFA